MQYNRTPAQVGDFHDAENRQRPCRIIIWHVKDPLSVCLAWALSTILNPSTASVKDIVRLKFGERDGHEIEPRRLIHLRGVLMSKCPQHNP
ncbi:hypothetical protein TNCV_3575641 [Trichonephila clavipes]|nr:hypothetical protein TNCV_3575641 [Trichonephila clavipes]